MGEVWAARHDLTQRDFAIKFLRRQLGAHREAVARFLAEARATGQIHHPSLVEIYDVGQTDDGRPYLVMELLKGETLAAILGRDRRLSVERACRFLAPIAEALADVHAAGLVHRDISPSNVFLSRGPTGIQPKLLDFGISKQTKEESLFITGDGAVLGSPAYMSPEQARGAETVDSRSDIWSFGVLLYECLVGRPPFSATNYNALMCAILSDPHSSVVEVAPAVPERLARSIEQCLVKKREHRLSTAAQVASVLRAAIEPPRAPGPVGQGKRSSSPASGHALRFGRNSLAPRLAAIAVLGTATGVATGLAMKRVATTPTMAVSSPSYGGSEADTTASAARARTVVVETSSTRSTEDSSDVIDPNQLPISRPRPSRRVMKFRARSHEEPVSRPSQPPVALTGSNDDVAAARVSTETPERNIAEAAPVAAQVASRPLRRNPY